MAIHADGTITTTTSEQTIGATQTAEGVYQLHLDFDAAAVGDRFVVSCYHKSRSAGSEKLWDAWVVNGDVTAQTGAAEAFSTPPLYSPYSITFKIKRIAGADRSIGYSIVGP